ncbi:MAG: exonuclease domain-containing protein [Candidatus Wenzhouxiangella sp. M2_3B_020]
MALRRWRWLRMMRARAAAARVCPPLEDALRAPLPRPSERIRETRLLAIDLEMTGLDPQTDSILTMGWVPIDAGGIDLGGTGEVAVAATAGEAVGESATIHGIRDCDRDRGVGSDAALAELMNALAGRIALFHHAPLDTAFLDRALRDTFGIGWLWPAVDTLAWFRRRQLGRDNEAAAASTRLDAVREHYGLSPRSSHNALDDAMSCAEVGLILAARSRAKLIDVCIVPARKSL